VAEKCASAATSPLGRRNIPPISTGNSTFHMSPLSDPRLRGPYFLAQHIGGADAPTSSAVRRAGKPRAQQPERNRHSRDRSRCENVNGRSSLTHTCSYTVRPPTMGAPRARKPRSSHGDFLALRLEIAGSSTHGTSGSITITSLAAHRAIRRAAQQFGGRVDSLGSAA